MPYATQSDITELYGANALVVADHDRDGVPDTEAVARALVYASSEIDTWLNRRYTLPLHEVPQHLKQLCVEIALYRLALSAELMTDQMQKRYDAALKSLMAISEGKAMLVFVTPLPGSEVEGNDPGTPQPIVQGGSERLFSRDKMRDF